MLNPVLDGLGFWRMLERLLVPVLGLPRPQLGAVYDRIAR
jgi:hypothetical protein